MRDYSSGPYAVLPHLRRRLRLRAAVLAALFPGLLQWGGPAMANPRGGVVVHGDVNIGAGAGGNLQIRQNSRNAIINWDSFSIGAGELTQFRQPGTAAAVLNRVTGGDPTAIHGALKANGNVFVINPNGILVGPGGSIDVHGLALSTLDVSNGEFLSGGDMVFKGGSKAGVTNLGRINAVGGDVFLIGRTISNSGSISASSGRVGLAAGEEVLLTAAENAGGERIFVRAKGSGVSGTGIYNDGTIEGAAVEMKAHGNIYALAINNKGSVRATGATNSGGRVFLKAPGGGVSNSGSIRASSAGVGSGGRVLIEAAYAKVDGLIRAQGGHVRVAATEKAEVVGTIDVSTAAGRGGEIVVEAREIEIGRGALVEASGETGGGSARIGGGFQGRDAEVANAESVRIDDGAMLRADAISSGRGGSVIVWADGDTYFEGEISATGRTGGGFVEVSGRDRLGFHGTVSTLSADGTAGTLLLDPTNGTVSSAADNFGGSPFNINAVNLVAALGSNNVVISTPSAGTDPGHLTFQSPVIWDSNFSLSTLAHGDIVLLASVQNAGLGDVNFVAGWNDLVVGAPGASPLQDPGSLVIDDFLGNPASYGNAGGSVRLGDGSQGAQVAVGSRGGITTVLGYDVVLTGGAANDRAVQIGYNPTLGGFAAEGVGAVRVRALNDVVLTAGQAGTGGQAGAGVRNHAKIGHGGRAVGDNGFNHTGSIEVLAGLGSGAGITGNILGQAGRNLEGFVQIGHGGVGGANSSGSFSGDITVVAGDAGRVEFVGGIGRRAFVQIGHGGHDVDAGITVPGGVGFHSGTIELSAGTDVIFTAGIGSTLNFNADSRAHAMIGHGGYSSTAQSAVQGHYGPITVEAGTGGVSGAVQLKAGDLDDNFVQIGHGGAASQVSNALADGFGGDIEVLALSGVSLLAGTGQTFRGTEDGRLFAHIGHGGYNSGVANNAVPAAASLLGHSGTISVQTSTGDILVYGGNTDPAFGSAGDGLGRLHFAQIGHGGHGVPGGHHGSIFVEATTGAIDFRGGTSTDNATDGTRNFALLGHGGHSNTRGVYGRAGDVISAIAGGDISFTAGGSPSGGRAFAQIGSGGYDADLSPAQVPGERGNLGDILVRSTGGSILFAATNGTANYAQIGLGGYATGGDHSGEILVEAFGSIVFTGGTAADAYAQIGHGGRSAPGNHSGEIGVFSETGNINFTGGSTTNTYAQLGHGGLLALGNLSDDIEVRAEQGGINFFAGAGTDAYALLGHGGRSSEGDRDGDITVVARQGIFFRGGTGTRGFAQLGHGGRPGPATVPVDGMTFNGNSTGDIRVHSLEGGIDFRWAATGTVPGNLAYVQLGHGGLHAVGNHTGTIEVLARGNILFQNVTGATAGRNSNYVQLGHGGTEAYGNHGGNITVLSDAGTITFRGGTQSSNDRYAQLGHGGLNAAGNHSGNIAVLADGAILFSSLGASTFASRGYMQLGHGGHNADATSGHTGNISVASRTGTITFQAAPDGSTESYAQLGHGGFDAAGSHEGDIVVRSGNQILFTAGTVASPVIGGAGGSYAQLGHGGAKAAASTDPAADLSGTITVSAQVAGGFNDIGDFFDALGNFGGDGAFDEVTIVSGTSGTSIQFAGGVANTTDQYAMLGHGGTNHLGDHSGAIDVTARRTVNFLGGAGTRGYVQLGHGGHGAIAATGHMGDIRVRTTGEGGVTANLVFTPGIGLESYAQLGHGGLGAIGDHSGLIVANANSAITFNANSGTIVDGYRAYAQIGHGGLGAAGDHSGNISVSTNLGSIAFTGGNATGDLEEDDRYAQIGHGGRNAVGDHGGDIAVVAQGAVTFVGGAGASRSYAQVGHGGHSAGGNGHSGRIGVATRTGAISFTSGTGTSTDSYVQIGHGGLGASGDHGGDLVVRAGNNLVLSGSAGTDTIVPDLIDPVNNPPTRIDHRGYAQIGHGGLLSEGDRSGAITVTSQIAGDYDDIGDLDGDGIADTVSVAAGTSTAGFAISGGTNATVGATDAYAQIGHGGRLARGENEGDIHVEALRLIRATAGQLGPRSYVQIGHGGSDAAIIGGGPGTTANSGDIFVTSETGVVEFIWAAAGTVTGHGTYAQLGHGGHLTDPAISGISAGGDNVGDIRVSAGTNLLFRSTTGGTTAAGTATQGNYVQLGHGGLRWTGDHGGNLSVRSGTVGATGTITFTAGDSANSHGDGVSEGGTDRYAHLGHGGNDAVGSHWGDIEVLSLGNVAFVAGRNPRSYAQLGHGGILAGGGGNSGDIRLASQTGNIDFRYAVDGISATATTDTPGIQSYAQLGHGGYENVGSNSGDIVVQAGGNLLVRGIRGNFPTGNLGNYVQIGHGGFAAEGDHSGNITVATGVGGTVAGLFDLDYDGSRDEVEFVSNGVGTLQLLSGGGAVDRYVQIGHGGRLARGDQGAVDGAGMALDTISITALGNVVVTSRGGTRGYAQIGNGGYDANLLVDPRGAAANIVVTSTGGSVLVTGSTGTAAYAQIGNGGYTTTGNHRGDITVEAAEDISFTAAQSLTSTGTDGYVQLGNGGRAAVGNHSGNILVRAGLGGVAGSVNFMAGRGSERYAHLGHGGRSANGDHSGDITVESWGGITFQGGDFRAFANTSSPNVATAAINGDGAAGLKLPTTSYINPGSLSITLADPALPEYGLIIDDGFGNLLDSTGATVGNINYANADVTFLLPVANGGTATSSFQASNFSRAYAQLGHGGSDTTAVVGSSGDIRVVAGLGGVGGDLAFSAGSGNESYALLGHGGRAGRGDHSGDIYADALGEVRFTGNQGMRTFAQLGHGGWDSDLNSAGSTDRGSSGDIFVNTRALVVSQGGIHFTAGTGEEAYVQLGHGGFGTRGAATGNLGGLNRIDVRSGGDIVFRSGNGAGFGDDTTLRIGNGRRAYAQLGHGGYDADAHNVDAEGYDGLGHEADIFVQAAGAVRFEATNVASDPFGLVAGPFANDFRNYVQLGHGGLAANGDHRGDITVSAGTGVEFLGGGVEATATANTSQDNYAQLGHGGYTTPGYGGNDTVSFSGAIDVSTLAGDIRFIGGGSTDGYVQLGHGGRGANGGARGEITVTAATGGLAFLAGEGAQHYAQLGHGGYNARGDHADAISVSVLGNIVFTGGAGAQTYAQLGHGGYDADNPNPGHYPDNDPLNPNRGPTAAERIGNSGSITVESVDGSLLFTTGSANNTYAQLGHGGAITDGDHTGDIFVKADADRSNAAGGGGRVLFDASIPTGTNHYAQIGHGGYLASGGHTGTVDIVAGGAIQFTAGPSSSYVQIGHGGRNDHRLSTTSPFNNNNDRYYAGTHIGDISVNAGGDILFDGYQFPAGGGTGTLGYAQIGHGGFRNAAVLGEGHSGAIDVISGGLLRFRAGPRSQTYAQIGHGGFEAFGDHGRRTVSSEGGASLIVASQGGTAILSNGGLAVGSVVVTVDPTGSGGGIQTFYDDGLGGLVDSTGALVGAIDYDSGQLTFVASVNPGGDFAEVSYQYGSSDIFVQARDGVEFSSDTTIFVNADQTYVQIGHGGYDADFQVRTLREEGSGISGTNHHLNTPVGTPGGTSGNITVLAGVDALGSILNPSASIVFVAGGEDDAYAQLGNGGRATSGSHQGDIVVRAGADIRFTAGTGQPESYAQLGNGGMGATSPNRGGGGLPTIGHRGDIEVAAGVGGVSGGIVFTGGLGTDNYAQLGHGGRSATGNHIGDIDVSSWGSIEFLGGGFRSLADTVSAGLTAAAETGGSGQFSTTAGIRPGQIVIRIANPTALEYGTITDDGNGNLLDGNGAVVGTVDYFTATATFAAPVSDVGGAVTADYDHFNFSRTYAMLGNGGSSANSNRGHGGDIRVAAGLGGVTGDIRFRAGQVTDSFVHLGNGGSSAVGDHYGDIYVDALGGIDFTGNWNFRTYAQLGNGGYNADLNTNTALFDSRATGNRGDIFVNTRTHLVTNTGGISFTAGGGEESYVQLGHGGYANRGANVGNLIEVRAAGDVVFTSGNGSGRGDDTSATSRFGDGRRAYAQLGHGGYDADAHNVDAEGTDGLGHEAEVRVVSGGMIRFVASDVVSDPTGTVNGPMANDFRNYVQLGHGGLATSGDHRGDIIVEAGTGIEFISGGVEATATANTSQDNYAQLGHGGYSAAGYGADSLGFGGDIEVRTTAGDIRFTGGNSTDGYVQLGHGGRVASNTLYRGDVEGDIRVTAEGGSIVFSGGTRNFHYAQLGHGGAALTSSPGVPFSGNNRGDITVEALGGGLSFLAGTSGSEVYAQLGHGGRSSRGDHEGDIGVVSLRDIVFTGGDAGQNYAQLGHGGYDADNPNPGHYPDNDPLNPNRGPTAAERIGNSGSITVETIDGSLLFTTGSANNTYAQLGHGGSQTDGDHAGDIFVFADRDRSNAAGGGGNIAFVANTAGTAHYAQLGHGGYRASGGSSGSITVEAGAAITFTGGGTSNYVQIGHGGRNDHRITRGGSSPNFTQTNDNDRYYPGTHVGAISVASGGDIAFTAGTGTGAFAQIGHGGYRNAAEAGEGHSGSIAVVGAGEIRFLGQTGTSAYVQIGHGGYEAFGNHGYAAVRAEAGFDAASQGGSASLANGAVAPGSLRVTVDPAGAGALFTDDGLGNLVDPGDALGLGAGAVVGTIDYATGQLVFAENLNAGGDEVLVAYLHGSSDILVDGGAGIVFAAGNGSTAYAQIGHGGVAAAFAATRNVQPEETAPATNTSTTTFHLNTPLANPIGTSGDITVLAGTGGTLDSGASLFFATGNGNDTYAQIGNGGRNARGDHRGEIVVHVAGDIAFDAFSGGAVTQTQTSGTLNNMAVNGTGTLTLAQTGNLVRDNSFVITYDNPLPGFSGVIRGDGLGRLFDGATEVGTISTGGVITFTVAVSSGTPNASVVYDHFNTGLRTYVQIGHGGHDADFPNSTTPGDPGNLGNLTVRSDSGAISFKAGSRSESYAQIGHGGFGTNGDHSGNIVVEAVGSNGAIAFASGTRVEAYAQIGHGGRSARGDFGLRDVDGDGLADGDISVRSTGTISFASGIGGQTYSQIGHGGYDSDTTTDPGIPGSRGDIRVESLAGDIAFSAVGSVGNNAYTQIGHGGMATSGDYSGSIEVLALEGNVGFTSGSANDRYAQVGHGGRQARGNQSGDIEVLGGAGVGFAGGGVRSIEAEQSVALRTAAETGGGVTATLANTGNLDRSSFVITLSDPTQPAYATLTSTADGQLLDGNGLPVGSVSTGGVVTFDVAVSNGGASTVTFAYDTSNYSRAYAQIGHGGHDADPTGAAVGSPGQTGDIRVASTAGNIAFAAGLGQESYAQIGNGGYAHTGDHSGTIAVRAAGSVEFTAGMTTATATGTVNSRVNNYAQIGHGGMSSSGHHSGSVSVSAGANGTFSDASSSPLNFSGVATGGLSLLSGTATDGYTQIGHGGRNINNSNIGGSVLLTTQGDIVLRAGSGGNTYAQIGLGGYGATDGVGNWIGDIVVRSTGGNVLLDAGSAAGTNAYVQIGNGGLVKGLGTLGGTSPVSTIVEAGGSLTLQGGSGGANRYAQIGAGGSGADGDKVNAGIGVTAASVLLTGGNSAGSYAHIGGGGGATSGGNASAGNIDGSVSVVTTSGGIDLAGGTGASRNYAQIGHGGTLATGNFSGDIHLDSAGAISLNGGTVATAHAVVGHGGLTTGIATRAAGARQGSLLIRGAGVASATDNSSLATFGHLASAGVTGSSRLAVVVDRLDLSASSIKMNALITSMINTGSVEIGFLGADLSVDGPALSFNSPHHIDFFSTRNVVFGSSVQNSGAGSVNVVAGWDGATGLVEDRNPAYPWFSDLALDLAAVKADPSAYANNGGLAMIGSGSQSFATSVGSRAGETNVLGSGVRVIGGSTAGARRGQIGYFGNGSGPITGPIYVGFGGDGLQVLGGTGSGAFAQIGHGGTGSTGDAVDSTISIVGSSDANLLLRGGAGNSASAMIGHGGTNLSAPSLAGDLLLSTGGNVNLEGGIGGFGFAQIGHGGASTDAEISGNLGVVAGGSILLSGVAASSGYSKIGHGDDLRAGFEIAAGTGTRSGDIAVSAGRNLSVLSGMVGHVNSLSPALATGGTTLVGVSRIDPTDPSGGRLIANSSAEFAGADGIRFYLPRRASNGIAAGARMNGFVYGGPSADPQPVQGVDEFTRHIVTSAGTLSPLEHDNSLGSGPIPATVEGFAFYFDTIVQGVAVSTPTPNPPAKPGPGPVVPPFRPFPDPFALVPDDRAFDDWIREQESKFSRPGTTGIYYEGFEHYGPNGESVFDLNGQSGAISEEDDVLRRHLDHLDGAEGPTEGE